MLILAIDTATPWGRFALAADGELLGYQPHNVTGSYADALLPVIDGLLAAAGRRLGDVDVVAVTDGPGSFTGVRIGVATAKTLAWALGARLCAVSTLAAMAADRLAAEPDRHLAVPVLDARRGEIFAGVFRRAGRWVAEVAAPACLSPDDWWACLRQAIADLEAPAYVGDGVALLVGEGERLRPELAARGVPAPRSWIPTHPATARALALALADPALRDATAISPFRLVPRYLRGSDAEVIRHVDATPAAPSPGVDIHSGLDQAEDRS
ncbi:MAG TPA: tRNA (adenosine(37)-N6)-threonylcarbamoyltransferase complex dimerization subunit type 1 TsaB [Candidatus Krumholzibacteria bacterium]|nr:tRNA (adenosine(37)-N6)-threonylcarbamoyltransferase complex dimerization subunit type 1 TsaB [Candidatus Krumholzibacteria bacterium]HPD72166.1 tRNA (adenosine(37)-N6)-threonylcarbamoyltransferase complex dimerization subunit type 1 TsaB [Candidatus Krumholzibacteria bacterium]HRY40902.1 tRNA (adenosine(37)-N6)-threonylcarbamoyltransferase complex dimerization subunit type 1 TsaB [Candidatus Krumholzibacteria bacterium]